jgi:ATP-dependent Clp protease ATP-binding subunit ClpB
MTSNIGGQAIQEIARGGGGDIREAVKEALESRFLPEFLNRIDETIIFEPLAAPQIRKIVDIQVERLIAQAEKNDLVLEVTPAARDEVARSGYDPTYGARPLKRVIQQRIQNPLASEILGADFEPGTRIKIDSHGGEFTFETLPRE